MSQLVAGASGAVKLDVIVAGDGGEQDFVGFGIDRGKHINVATTTLHIRHVAVSINAANKDSKRLGRNVDINICNIFSIYANLNGIKDASSSAKAFFATFGKVV